MQVIVNRALRAVENAKEQHAIYLAAIAALRKGLSKKREPGRAKLLPMVARYYGVAVVDGKGKATGSLVLDSEAVSYEAARKALQRMLDDIYGKVAGAGMTDPVEKLLKDYAELTAAQKRKFRASI